MNHSRFALVLVAFSLSGCYSGPLLIIIIPMVLYVSFLVLRPIVEHFIEVEEETSGCEKIYTTWGIIYARMNGAGAIGVVTVKKLFDGFNKYSVEYTLKKALTVESLKMAIKELDIEYEKLLRNGIMAKVEFEKLKRTAQFGADLDGFDPLKKEETAECTEIEKLF